MKTITTLCLLLFMASASAAPAITYDVLEDVTQYGISDPVVESYHLIVTIRDLEVSKGESKVILLRKMLHWKFSTFDEGVQTRESILRLKDLLEEPHHEILEKISEIVRELTNGTKPDTLE